MSFLSSIGSFIAKEITEVVVKELRKEIIELRKELKEYLEVKEKFTELDQENLKFKEMVDLAQTKEERDAIHNKFYQRINNLLSGRV